MNATIPQINSNAFNKYDPYEILDYEVYMKTFISESIKYQRLGDNKFEIKAIHKLLSLLNVKGLGVYSAIYNLLANDFKSLRNEIIRTQIKRLHNSSDVIFEIGTCFFLSTGLTYLRYKMTENGKMPGKSIKGLFLGLVNWDIDEFADALKTDDNVRIQAMTESLTSVIVLVANYYYYNGIKENNYVSNCIVELLSFLNERQKTNYITSDLFDKKFKMTLKYYNQNSLKELFQKRDSVYFDLSNKFNNNETITTIIERFKVSDNLEYGCFL